MYAHPRRTLLLSWLIAAAVVVVIASSDGLDAIVDVIGRLDPRWLLVALALELIAYAGYVAAYRSSVHSPGRPRLPLRLTIKLVVAGFGPFVTMGGFSLDRMALRAVHDDDRAARLHVLGLGVIEYVLLAPVAWLCALIMLVSDPHASPALTLPWVIAVPPGFALGAWFSHPRRRRRLPLPAGRVRDFGTEVLTGVAIMRRLFSRPQAYAGAILGMGLYWAAEIGCLGAALRCVDVRISLPALVVAHATGYAASRRSLPLGGAGVTEALLTVALVWVGVPAPSALVAVVLYRLVNFAAPTLPALLAHASIGHLLRPRGPRRPRRDGRVARERVGAPSEM